MTRWILKVLALASIAFAAFVATERATATTSGATVPVTGTAANGATFAGAMTVTGTAVRDGQTVALGTVSGTLSDAAGNTIAPVSDVPFAAPVSGDPCTLVSFSFGPFDIDVIGITVHIDPIAANVTLGGLLGEILCPLLGGTGTTTAPA